MRKYLVAAVVLLSLAMLLPSCSVSPGSQGQAGATANFRLLVSDEPNDIGDFSSLDVAISKIGVLAADSDNWTEITVDPPQTVDLTILQGDNASAVWEGAIPSGNYTKVFVYVDNVTGVLAGSSGQSSTNATVKLPGGKLQISKPFTVSNVGGSAIVSFVFDITVIKAGESGKYILKPQVAASGVSKNYNDVTPATSPTSGKNTEPKGRGKNH